MVSTDKDKGIIYGVRYYPQSQRHFPIRKENNSISMFRVNEHTGIISCYGPDSIREDGLGKLMFGEDHDEALGIIRMYLKQREELKNNPPQRDTFVDIWE